jgi:hypothetical protein
VGLSAAEATATRARVLERMGIDSSRVGVGSPSAGNRALLPRFELSSYAQLLMVIRTTLQHVVPHVTPATYRPRLPMPPRCTLLCLPTWGY